MHMPRVSLFLFFWKHIPYHPCNITLGVCDVSRESIEWIVTKQGPGNAAVIVVGGAAEALEARPGNYKLTLKNRKGFVKLAMRTG